MHCWRNSELARRSRRRPVTRLGPSQPRSIHARLTSSGNLFACTLQLITFIYPNWFFFYLQRKIEVNWPKGNKLTFLFAHQPLSFRFFFEPQAIGQRGPRMRQQSFKRVETDWTLWEQLVPSNRYFYHERWLLFHRTNHQKLAQFYYLYQCRGACSLPSVHGPDRTRHISTPEFPYVSNSSFVSQLGTGLICVRTNSPNGNVGLSSDERERKT